jgi:hypothetical protein
MNKERKKVTIDYLNFLKDLQNELILYNHRNVTKFAEKHFVTKSWTTFLINKNIIYKDKYGDYRWNEKIPASIKIVSQFRKETSERNALRKLENNKTTVQQELNLLIESQKTKKKLVTKVNPKKVIKVPPKMIREDFKNTDKQELGLIRRFLKWIY